MTHRLTLAFAASLAVAGAATLFAQLPIPVQGQTPQIPGQGQGRGGRGRGGEAQQAPDPPPVVSAIAAATPEITGPGKFYETLMELKPGDDLAHFGYVTKEYFVSGTANGQPYKTRIVIRKPSDDRKISGLALVESMHPSGNPWMFHFTHRYSMTEGHVGVEILTTTPQGIAEANPDRYKSLVVQQGQASEIIAQVGALLKSNHPDNPLPGKIRKMILAGSSASAAVVVNYLPASMVQRLADMKPIYDGFMPTSNGTNLRKVDVPMIQVPTMREVFQGFGPTRVDGDAPGDQFRIYEFAGMAHIDSRDAAAYYPDPCKQPISRYPLAAYMSVALSHFWQWIDKGVVPPHADRFYVDYNMDRDGSLLALDEHGNVKGGIHTTYIDVPAAKFGVPNSGAEPPIKNPHPFIAARGEAAQNQLCGLANYQITFTPEQMKKLYKDQKTYVAKVMQRYDELVKEGWALPVYRDVIKEDAEKVRF
jgi:hypothetical protein